MQTDPNIGLHASEVATRQQRGLVNTDSTVRTKSIQTILYENICTLFNIVNFVLAIAVAAVGSYRNMLFMGVVLCNLLIGIVQEIRAKRSVDRLSLVAAATVAVRRDGTTVHIHRHEVVQDDILLLSAGVQIAADSVLLEGICDVNESFITGEADAVTKRPGDMLYAGSFVVSGNAVCRATQVGDGNYIAKISGQVKYVKTVNSEIMTTLKKIIKIISIIIIPVGILLFLNQFSRLDTQLSDAVVNTVAALIGMIPEGLMLLTSTVLAVAVMRLSRKHVLVQDLYCIETLARVDVLCLDKTGTITEGSMEYCGVIPFREDAEAMLALLAQALDDHNPSINAIKQALGEAGVQPSVAVPFDSTRKWSGVSIDGKGSILLGAAEFLTELPPAQQAILQDHAKDYRVLLLAHSPNTLSDKSRPEALTAIGLVLLRDKIRTSAPDTIRYFEEQGVTLKVISGDAGETVSNIAQRAGITGAQHYLNANGLSDAELIAAAEQYTVFGRVTPPQKKLLVEALQQNGHTVSMTGDGVNDVMALKQADCSIAMASGSEAARNVSELVLVDSDFASMPEIVAQGRRSINNIQRSASLFLVKTIYSAVLAVLFILLPRPYPFVPIQLTLISALTIGAPSFVLALEPNRERICGRFLRNILTRAVPGGITTVLSVLLATALGAYFALPQEMISTISFIATATTGLAVLFRVCMPFNRLRTALFALMAAGLGISVLFYRFFELVPLNLIGLLLAIGLSVFAAVNVYLLTITFLRRDTIRKPRKSHN